MDEVFSCLVNCIFLFLCLVIAIPYAINYVSEILSLLGTYHSLNLTGGIWKKMNVEKRGVEDFATKYEKMLILNLVFTIIIMVSFYFIIPVEIQNNLDKFQLRCFTLVLTLVSLITLRLLSNQSYLFAPGAKNKNPIEREDYVINRNEKVIGHFHTLICTALMIFIIECSIILLKSINFLDFATISHNLDNRTMLSLGQFGDIKPEYNRFAFCVYFGFLPFITFVVEIILVFLEPIIKDNTYDIEKSFLGVVTDEISKIIRSDTIMLVLFVGICTITSILILFSLIMAALIYSGIWEYH